MFKKLVQLIQILCAKSALEEYFIKKELINPLNMKLAKLIKIYVNVMD